MNKDPLLKGKAALITGASRGIGRSIAETFVQNGASVVISGRSEAIHQTAKHLADKEIGGAGATVRAVQGDLREKSHIKELVQTCKTTHGGLDILVNNAGILKQALLGMNSGSTANDLLEVNTIAMINLTQYAIRIMGPTMVKCKSPSIINITSIAGTQGIEGLTLYSASKAAVIGFTLSSAKELAARQIRVNAIAPGFIDTDMTRSLPKEWFEKRVESIRMGRIGKPQDVANCALFLASDLAEYITGQIIEVDGGIAV